MARIYIIVLPRDTSNSECAKEKIACVCVCVWESHTHHKPCTVLYEHSFFLLSRVIKMTKENSFPEREKKETKITQIVYLFLTLFFQN